MTSLGWPSLIPPLVAIALAFLTRRILISLSAGVIAAVLLLNLSHAWVTPFRALDEMVKVAAVPSNLQLIAFSLVVGALLKLIRDANGFAAFGRALEGGRGTYGKGSVYAITFALSSAIFLECWSNILISGTTMAPLYDRIGVSRQRLAYFIHTIGLNTVAMVVINGWGAFYMSLLRAQNVAHPFNLVLAALPYNLYSWISLALVVVVMATGLTIGPIRGFETAARARAATAANDPEPDRARVRGQEIEPRVGYLVAPVATLVATMVASLYLTGGGDLTRGDGSASILYAAVAATAVIALQLLLARAFTPVEIEEKALAGMRDFFDVSLLIVVALSLGALCKQIGTGLFISQLVQQALPAAFVPLVVFLLGSVMSFATGTSYGTLAIMMPLVLPIASATHLPTPLLFAACLSGAVFGDNTSPINDNIIITSMASGSSVVDHVRTQMPYALIAAGLSAVGFVIIALVQLG